VQAAGYTKWATETIVYGDGDGEGWLWIDGSGGEERAVWYVGNAYKAKRR